VARTKSKRQRKHRGTQGGRIDRRAKKPRTRAEAKSQLRTARKGRKQRRQLKVPTWRGAIVRAAFGAVLFFVLVALVFGQAIGPSIALSVLMFGIYLPLGHTVDRFMYRRAQAKLERG
jgi:L-asparagine transporter-like permease